MNAKLSTASYCFGGLGFHVAPGEVAYIGDFIPYWNVRLASGAKMGLLAYASHAEDARKALAKSQPALATAMKPATLYGKAIFECSAIDMDRWDVPGTVPLPGPAPAATTVAAV